jgi:hypothetical protein
MKSSILVFVLIFPIQNGEAQPRCKTTLPIDVRICGLHSRVTDTALICTQGTPRILPADTSLKILSFVLTVGDAGIDGDIFEIPVTGNILNGRCIQKLREVGPGSFIEIGCIKAISKDGHTVYLNTYFREY